MAEQEAPPKPPSKLAAMNDFGRVLRSNHDVFVKLVKYTAIMFTVPIAVFLFLDRVVLPDFDIDEETRNTWSALVAVVVIQFICFVYVCSAMLEPDDGVRPGAGVPAEGQAAAGKAEAEKKND
uniref:Vacuolar ATPase assembly integral membrane protein VMA21 homolog n=1 Tax=Eutreptiella gymnastica TaxID=73025 RepID=A0A7S1HZT1_9EUGL